MTLAATIALLMTLATADGKAAVDSAPEGSGWVYAPLLGRTLATASKTPWSKPLTVIVPDAMRKRIEKADGAMVLSWSPRHSGGDAWYLGMDMAAADGCADWLKERRRRIAMSTPIDIFTKKGQCGLNSRAFGAGTGSLRQSAYWRRLAADRGNDAIIGAVDMMKVYGHLARGAKANQWITNLTRLGVANLKSVVLRGRLNADGHFESRVEIELPGKPEGLLAALDGAVAPVDLRRMPAEVESMTRLAMRPAAFLQSFYKLASFNSPLRYSIARAHLDTVEQQLGKRLAEDALGDKPAALTVYGWRQRGASSIRWLADMEVADAKLTLRIIDRYVAMLTAAEPQLSVERKGDAGMESLWVRDGGRLIVVIAADAERLMVGSDAGIWRRYQNWRRGAKATTGGSTGGAISSAHRGAFGWRAFWQNLGVHDDLMPKGAQAVWGVQRRENGYLMRIDVRP